MILLLIFLLVSSIDTLNQNEEKKTAIRSCNQAGHQEADCGGTGAAPQKGCTSL